MAGATDVNEGWIEGKWHEFKGEAMKAWGELTDDDLEKTKGDLVKMRGVLEQKYGEAERSLAERFNELAGKFRESPPNAPARGEGRAALHRANINHVQTYLI